MIKTTNGHIFGGFTTISWDSSGSYKNDFHSFLFSLDRQTKFPIAKNYLYAIYCYPSYGPTFGNYDIYVSDNSNSSNNSYVGANLAYNMPVVPGKSYPVLTDGNYNF